MTKKQATNLMNDLRRSLTAKDFCEDVYFNTSKLKSRSYKKCAYFDTERWLFIWTHDESHVFDKNEIGDFVFAPASEIVLTITKEKSCY